MNKKIQIIQIKINIMETMMPFLEITINFLIAKAKL
jgi:hypothetical protein